MRTYEVSAWLHVNANDPTEALEHARDFATDVNSEHPGADLSIDDGEPIDVTND